MNIFFFTVIIDNMSLLLRKTFSLSRLAVSPTVTVFKRFNSGDSNSATSAIAKKESKDKIVEMAPKTTKIITADVISGAPGKVNS